MTARSARKRSQAGRVAPFEGKPRRILGYARVSSEEQTKGSSLDDQQRAIRVYAESIGVPVARMFVEAETGILDTREQVRALLAEVRAGDLVVCHKLDRWSRDPAFSYTSVAKIVEAGADFYLLTERCGPRDDNWDTLFGVHALVAKLEHKRIKERLVGTRSLLIDQGYFAAGIVPHGYRRRYRRGEKGPEKNALVIVEEEAEQVREIFRRCAAGQPINRIMREMEVARGLVVRTLRNRVYRGELLNTRGEWIKGRHEPIVDADLFARARAALDARRNGGPRPRETPARTSTWILRDVARCAKCGARMSVSYTRKLPGGGYQNYYYACAHDHIDRVREGKPRCRAVRISVPLVEAQAEPLILARLAELREELGREPQQVKRASLDGQTIAAKRATLARKRERYLEAFADDLMTREELRERMAKLDAESVKLDGLEAAVAKASPLADPVTRRAVLRTVAGIRRAWSKATPEERRKLVGLLANEARLLAGKLPVFVWRSAEELLDVG